MDGYVVSYSLTNKNHQPAVVVEREDLVVVDVPVLALADELAEMREDDVLRRDRHPFVAVALKEVPVAVVLDGESTFRPRRR